MNKSRNLIMLIIGMFCLAVSGMTAASESAPAEKYYLFVLNDAAPGLEDEFNKWYDEQHAQDVLINPTYVDSQRYAVSERQLLTGAKVPNKYVIRFEIVTQNIARSLEYIHENIRARRTVPTNSIATGAGAGGDFVYKAITDVKPGRAANAKNKQGTKTTKYLYMVFSTATAGKEQQFNDWYNKVHAPKVAALAGVTQWQRFELSPAQLSPQEAQQRKIADATQYVVMYDIEVSDDAMFDRLQKKLQTLEKDGPGAAGKIGASYTYRAIGPRLFGDDVKKERASQSH